MQKIITQKKIKGLNVILCPYNNISTTYIDLAFNAGPMYETKSNNGISHFIEHLLSKEITRSMPGNNWIKPYWDENFDAYTFINRSNFEILINHQDSIDGLKHILSIFNIKSFTKQEIEIEKNIISEELSEKADDPSYQYMLFFLKNFYLNQPVSKPVIGTKKTLKNINVHKINRSLKNIIYPANATLTIAGNIGDTNKLLSEIRSLIPSRKDDTKPKIKPFKKYNNELIINRKKNQQNSINFAKPIINNNPNINVKNEFFVNIIRDYLFYTLREQLPFYRLITDITSLNEFSTFEVQIFLHKSNTQKFLNLFNSTIHKFKNECTVINFNKLKKNYIKNLQINLDEPKYLANLASWYKITYNHNLNINKFIKVIENCNIKELYTFSDYLFSSQNLSIFIEGEISSKDEKFINKHWFNHN